MGTPKKAKKPQRPFRTITVSGNLILELLKNKLKDDSSIPKDISCIWVKESDKKWNCVELTVCSNEFEHIPLGIEVPDLFLELIEAHDEA